MGKPECVSIHRVLDECFEKLLPKDKVQKFLAEGNIVCISSPTMHSFLNNEKPFVTREGLCEKAFDLVYENMHSMYKAPFSFYFILLCLSLRPSM
jgi:hypothetical protein